MDEENEAPHIWIPGVDDVKEHTEQHYGDAQYTRNPAGHIFVGGKEVAQTLMCCHCGMHFVSRKGSGKIRGYCFKHGAVTCGQQKCFTCIDIYTEYGITQEREL